MTASENLISVEGLKGAVSASIKLLDASWYLPSQNIDSHAAFNIGHIPGAQFFDIDKICELRSPFPHMLPSEAQFSQAISQLGISSDDAIVVYDTAGLFSSARVWWMFKVFGHENVKVLNGGLPAWIAGGGVLSSTQEAPTPTNYSATLNSAYLADREQILEVCQSPGNLGHLASILDARPAGRFQGVDPEPRPELSSGHMPRAISLPASELIENGFLHSRDELQKIFASLQLSPETRIITTCGSGVTAAIITLALAECGFGLQRLYDGAWAEWAATVPPELIVKDAC